MSTIMPIIASKRTTCPEENVWVKAKKEARSNEIEGYLSDVRTIVGATAKHIADAAKLTKIANNSDCIN